MGGVWRKILSYLQKTSKNRKKSIFLKVVRFGWKLVHSTSGTIEEFWHLNWSKKVVRTGPNSEKNIFGPVHTKNYCAKYFVYVVDITQSDIKFTTKINILLHLALIRNIEAKNKYILPTDTFSLPHTYDISSELW